MQVKGILSSTTRRAVRSLAAIALLSSGLALGIAGTAGAISGPAAQLAFTTPPSGAVGGAAFTGQPAVTVQDSGGSTVQSDSSFVTLSILGNPANVTLSCAANPLQASSGVATFVGCKINRAGTYNLVATDGSLTSATSPQFTVTVGGPSQLVFTTQPSLNNPSGAPMTTQPVVAAEDAGGNVVTSAAGSVTAGISSGTAVLSGTTANFVNGVATFTSLQLTNPDTTNTLTFNALSLPTLSVPSVTVYGSATHLAITQQPSASIASGAFFALPLTVQVQDAGGYVVGNSTQTITAQLTNPSNSSSVTNGTKVPVGGIATFTGLAVNASTGSYSLTFSNGTYTAVSNAFTVTVGGAFKLAIIIQPSPSVASGAALAVQPVVQIQDSGGNAVTSTSSSVLATFTAGGVSLTNNQVNAVSGVATFAGLTLNALTGPYTLTFSDGSLTQATSNSIAVTVGAPVALSIATQPSSTGASGVALAQQPVVKIVDSGGNAVTGNSSTVTATITSSIYTASNNTAVAANGVATFVGLTLTAPIAPYTLTFTDGALPSVTSNTISIASGVATHLVITTPPSMTTASGTTLVQVPVVKVEDALGNVVTSNTSTITATLTPAAAGSSLTNGAQVAVAGVGTFTGLAINALAGSYTLTFSDGALTAAVSSAIAVSAGNASKLVVTTEPSALTTSGTALAIQPIVKVEDSGGNVITGLNSGYVTASINTGAGGSINAGSIAPIVAGVAAFSGLAITGASGTAYTLTYSGDSFTQADATTITVGTFQGALSLTSIKGVFGRTLTLTTSGGSGTGAVSFTASNGTATGCQVSGHNLTFTSVGTCIVTATKAGDSTYLTATSTPTTVTVTKLPVPGVVRVTFTSASGSLGPVARAQLAALVPKLTVNSVVIVSGYAKGNLALAKARAAAAGSFLLARVHVKIHYTWVTSAALQIAQVKTVAQ